MKSKLLVIIISAILAASAATTAIVLVVKNQGEGPDAGGTSSSISQSVQDSSSVSNPDSSNPPEVEPEPVDRKDNNLSNLTNTYLSMPVTDVLSGGTEGLKAHLHDYMLGDVYNEVLVIANGYVAGSIPGMNGNFLTKYFGYVYYSDGNWYDNYGNKTHIVLNELLSYRLDGSKKLNINLSLYGESTVAEIFFGYTPNIDAHNAMDDIKNGMITRVMQMSDLAGSVLNMNMEQVVAILEGTDQERYDAIVEVFNEVSLSDALMFVESDAISENDFLEELSEITVGDFDEMLKLEDEIALYEKLADVFSSATVGDVLNLINPERSQDGYLSGMYLDYVFEEAAAGNLLGYIAYNLGDSAVSSILAEIVDEATLAEITAQYPQLSTLTVNALIELALKKGVELEADVMRMLALIEQLKAGDTSSLNAALQMVYASLREEIKNIPDDLGALKGVLDEIFAKLVESGMTVEEIQLHAINLAAMVQNRLVIVGEEISNFDVAGFIEDLKAQYGAVINDVLARISPELTIDSAVALISATVQNYVAIYNEKGAQGLIEAIILNLGLKYKYEAFVAQYGETISTVATIAQAYITKYQGVYAEGGQDALIGAIIVDLKNEIHPLAVAYLAQYINMTPDALLGVVNGYIAKYQQAYADGGREGLIATVAGDVMTVIDGLLQAETGAGVDGWIAIVKAQIENMLVELKVDLAIIESAKAALNEAASKYVELLQAGDYEGFVTAVYEAVEKAIVDKCVELYGDVRAKELYSYNAYSLNVGEVLDLLVALSGEDEAAKETAINGALAGLTVEDIIALLGDLAAKAQAPQAPAM